MSLKKHFFCKKSVKKVFIYITNKCNLSCDYCFVKKGKKSLQNKDIKKIFEKFELLTFENCFRIVFYGGEPTLNLDFVKTFINNIRIKYPQNIIKYSIITNGLKLHQKDLFFFKENDISLTLSIDGDFKSSELRIKDYRKFMYLEKRIKTFLKKFNFMASMTVTKMNIQRIYHNLIYLKSLGFRVVGFNFDINTKLNYKKILKNGFFKKILNLFFDSGFIVYPLIPNFIDYVCKKNKNRFCGIFEDILAIDIDLNLLPCQQYNMTDNFKNYKSKIYLDYCKRCNIFSFCGGGCNWLYMNNKKNFLEICNYTRELYNIYQNIEKKILICNINDKKTRSNISGQITFDYKDSDKILLTNNLDVLKKDLNKLLGVIIFSKDLTIKFPKNCNKFIVLINDIEPKDIYLITKVAIFNNKVCFLKGEL